MIYKTFLGGPQMRIMDGKLKVYKRTVYFATQALAANDVHCVFDCILGDVVLAAWLNVEVACDENAEINLGYGDYPTYFGNKLMVDTVGHARSLLYGSKTWNAYLVFDKSELTTEIEITGTRFGDHVTVSSGMDIADMSITGEVIHKDWVAIRLINNTGGALDLASQTITVAVDKAPMAKSPLVLSAADTIDIKAGKALTQGVVEVSALILRS